MKTRVKTKVSFQSQQLLLKQIPSLPFSLSPYTHPGARVCKLTEYLILKWFINCPPLGEKQDIYMTVVTTYFMIWREDCWQLCQEMRHKLRLTGQMGTHGHPIMHWECTFIIKLLFKTQFGYPILGKNESEANSIPKESHQHIVDQFNKPFLLISQCLFIRCQILWDVLKFYVLYKSSGKKGKKKTN